MSDTPMTDADAYNISCENGYIRETPDPDGDSVNSCFARHLERKLAEMTKRAELADAHAKDLTQCNADLEIQFQKVMQLANKAESANRDHEQDAYRYCVKDMDRLWANIIRLRDTRNDIYKKLIELRGGMELGQINCDAIFEDLKTERDEAKEKLKIALNYVSEMKKRVESSDNKLSGLKHTVGALINELDEEAFHSTWTANGSMIYQYCGKVRSLLS